MTVREALELRSKPRNLSVGDKFCQFGLNDKIKQLNEIKLGKRKKFLYCVVREVSEEQKTNLQDMEDDVHVEENEVEVELVTEEIVDMENWTLQ
jgi:hypothetical protein